MNNLTLQEYILEHFKFKAKDTEFLYQCQKMNYEQTNAATYYHLFLYKYYCLLQQKKVVVNKDGNKTILQLNPVITKDLDNLQLCISCYFRKPLELVDLDQQITFLGFQTKPVPLWIAFQNFILSSEKIAVQLQLAQILINILFLEKSGK